MRNWTKIGLAAIGATMLASAAYAQDYTIGVSNTVQGNGWREEMICAIKAQALASGKVKTLNIAHRNTDAAGQLEDLRNLISAKVDAWMRATGDPRVDPNYDEFDKYPYLAGGPAPALTLPRA